jgi:tape measure domain-containing protein
MADNVTTIKAQVVVEGMGSYDDLVKKSSNATTSVEKLIAKFQQQADLFNKSTEEINKYKAIVAKASSDEVAMAAAIGRTLDAKRAAVVTEKELVKAYDQAIAMDAKRTSAMDAQIQRMGRLQSQAEAMNKKFDEQKNSVNNASGAGKLLAGVYERMLAAAVAYMGVALVKETVALSDAWQNMQARLTIATGSMEKAKAAQQDLYDLSQKLAIPLAETVQLYTRMAPAMEKMGRSTADTLKVTEAMGLALKLSGATSQEASSAMLQFSQSMNSGVLNGQEFNAVSEAAPLILVALEKQLGKTRGELKKMGADGKLTMDLVTNALLVQVPVWEESFKTMPVTAENAFQRLKNSYAKNVGESDFVREATVALAKVFLMLADNLNVVGAALTAGVVVLGAYAVATGALTTAFAAAYGAMGTLVTSVLALNPPMLALVAVATALGAAFVYLAVKETELEKAGKKLADNYVEQAEKLATLNKLKQQYGELADGAKRSAAEEIEKNKVAIQDIKERIGLEIIKQRLMLNTNEEIYKSDRIKEYKAALDIAAKALQVNEANLYGVEHASAAANAEMKRFAEHGTKAAEVQKYLDKAPSNIRLKAIKEENEAYAQSLKDAGDNLELQKKALAVHKEMLAHINKGEIAKATAEETAYAESLKTHGKAVADLIAHNITLKEQIAVLNSGGNVKTITSETEAYNKLNLELDSYNKSLAILNRQGVSEKAKKVIKGQISLVQEKLVPAKEGSDLSIEKANTEANRRANDKLAASITEATFARYKAVAAVQAEVEMYGKGSDAVRANTIQLEEASLAEAKKLGLDENAIKKMEERIDTLKALLPWQQKLDDLKYNESVHQQAMNAWKELGDTIGSSLSQGFGTAGKALGDFVSSYGSMLTEQAQLKDKFDKEVAAHPKDQARLEKEYQDKSTQGQLKSYASMAKSAQGFFKEGSTGWKVMGAVEKGIRIANMAMAVQEAVVKMSSLKAVDGANESSMLMRMAMNVKEQFSNAVTGVSKALASAPPPFNLSIAAVTAAAFAALGIGVIGAFSGGSGSGQDETQTAAYRQKNQGTGTVFGDASAKSESIAKSLEIMVKASDSGLAYDAGMLQSLRAIEAGINNLAAVGARQGVTGSFGASAGYKYLTDSGLTGSATSLGSIMGGGGINAQQYATEELKSKNWLGQMKTTGYVDHLTALSSDMQSQFSNIVLGMADSITKAGMNFGVSADVMKEKLSKFVVDIGHISLMGLSADEIQKELNAVFGKMGDEMAAFVATGADGKNALSEFQKVGEGSFETLIRISNEFTTTNAILDAMGTTSEKAFGVTGIASLKAREQLIDFAGGLDNLVKGISSYNKNFYTAAEQTKMGLDALQKSFTEMNMGTLPTTREAYRKMIENLVNGGGLATEAGRKQYAQLILLSDKFAELVPQTEAATTAISNYVQAQKDMIKQYSAAETVDEAYAKLKGTFSGLVDQTTLLSMSSKDLKAALIGIIAGADPTTASGKALLDSLSALSPEIDILLKASDDYAAALVKEAEAKKSATDSMNSFINKYSASMTGKQARDSLVAKGANPAIVDEVIGRGSSGIKQYLVDWAKTADPATEAGRALIKALQDLTPEFDAIIKGADDAAAAIKASQDAQQSFHDKYMPETAAEARAKIIASSNNPDITAIVDKAIAGGSGAIKDIITQQMAATDATTEQGRAWIKAMQDLSPEFDILIASAEKASAALVSSIQNLMSAKSAITDQRSAITDAKFSVGGKYGVAGYGSGDYVSMLSGRTASARAAFKAASVSDKAGAAGKLVGALQAQFEAQMAHTQELRNQQQQAFEANRANAQAAAEAQTAYLQNAQQGAEALNSIYIGLKEAAEQLLLSDLSPRTISQRVDIAKETFDSLARRAGGGDQDALSKLGQAGNEYLTEFLTKFPRASAEYGKEFDRVQGLMEQFGGKAQDPAALTAQYSQQIAQATFDSAGFDKQWADIQAKWAEEDKASAQALIDQMTAVDGDLGAALPTIDENIASMATSLGAMTTDLSTLPEDIAAIILEERKAAADAAAKVAAEHQAALDKIAQLQEAQLQALWRQHEITEDLPMYIAEASASATSNITLR